MIQGVFGLPRAGKTSFLVWLALRAQKGKPLSVGWGGWKVGIGTGKKYRRVYTTFPCSGCYQLNHNDLPKYDFSKCLILIDEISLLIDSRNWKNFSAALNEFFSLHGHYMGCDIVYASQGYADTDKRIRDRTASIFVVDKMGGFSVVHPIRKQWLIDNDITDSYTLAPPLSCTWLWRRRLYQSFDSYEHAKKPAPPAVLWSPAAPAAPPVNPIKTAIEKMRAKLHSLASVRRTRKGKE